MGGQGIHHDRAVPPGRFSWRALFSPQEGHEPALDGMRAVAVLLIFGFHAEFWLFLRSPALAAAVPRPVDHVLRNSWVGVDVFFVLSGFLIGRILLQQLHRGEISLKAFYLRRTFRIFPAYYLVLTLSLFVFSRLPTFHPLYHWTPWTTLLERSWANYLYVSNYAYGGEVPNALMWGWSLCVEEHFYLILPAVLVLLFRHVPPGGRLAILFALTLVPVAARLIGFATDSVGDLPAQRVYPNSHTHFDGLLLGVVIAYAWVFHRAALARACDRLGGVLGVFGLACFVVVFVWGGVWKPGAFTIVWQFLVLGAGAGALLLDALRNTSATARVLSRAFWRPLARLSYGIYLIHLFPIHLVLQWWPDPNGSSVALAMIHLLGFLASALLLTILAAAVLYLVVERPMLEWGARLSRMFPPARIAAVPPSRSRSSS